MAKNFDFKINNKHNSYNNCNNFIKVEVNNRFIKSDNILIIDSNDLKQNLVSIQTNNYLNGNGIKIIDLLNQNFNSFKPILKSV
jgi:hypothetical protein